MTTEMIKNIILANIEKPVKSVIDEIHETTGKLYHYDYIRKIKKTLAKESELGIAGPLSEESFNTMRSNFIEDVKKHSYKYKEIKRSRKEGNLLIIDPADIHVGKLASPSRVNAEYGPREAIRRVTEGVRGILDKVRGHNITQIWLVIGNDVLHTEAMTNATTKGTPQESVGTPEENYRLAQNMYVTIIEELMNLADVHVIFNPSNHDHWSGFTLAESIRSWFNKCKNVTFDTDLCDRKYKVFGNNLIMTSHGDQAKEEDYVAVMPNEKPQEWAATKHRYVYLHHIHRRVRIKYRSGVDWNGVTVQYLRSPSEADTWHFDKTYNTAPKAVEAFVHSPTEGQIAIITHHF